MAPLSGRIDRSVLLVAALAPWLTETAATNMQIIRTRHARAMRPVFLIPSFIENPAFPLSYNPRVGA